MKYCKNCGAELNDDAMFCKKCGKKYEEASQEVNQGTTQATQATQSKPIESGSHSSNGLIIGIVIAAVVLISVILIINASNNSYYSNATYDSYDVVEDDNEYVTPTEANVVQEIETYTETATFEETQVVIEADEYEDDIDDYHYDTSEYMINGSDSWYIAEGDLIGLGPWECKVARNEIYARHGRLFKDNQLQQYFNSKSWYYGYIEPDYFDENVLSPVEKANVITIKNYEKSMGW